MNYYLAANGNDANDGKSRLMAWKTDTFAIPRLVVGDVLYVYDDIIVPPQPSMISIIGVPSPSAVKAIELVPPSPVAGKIFGVVIADTAPSAASDWIAIFKPGAPKNAYLDWRYLDNTKTRPATGIRPAVVMFKAPAAGSYEMRLLAAGSQWLAMVSFTVG